MKLSVNCVPLVLFHFSLTKLCVVHCVNRPDFHLKIPYHHQHQHSAPCPTLNGGRRNENLLIRITLHRCNQCIIETAGVCGFEFDQKIIVAIAICAVHHSPVQSSIPSDCCSSWFLRLFLTLPLIPSIHCGGCQHK